MPLVVCHFQSIESKSSFLVFLVLEEEQEDEDTEDEHRGEKFEEKIDRNGGHEGLPVERSRALTIWTPIYREQTRQHELSDIRRA